MECPYCGRAEPVVRKLLADYGDLRYVWRHLPLTDVHPHAQLAAKGAEAPAGQGKFWPMHDQLLDHQGALTGKDLIRYAGELGLDTDRFARDLRNHAGQVKIAADVDSADLSGVSGTPAFFVNGKRHHGAYDIGTLSDAVRTAGTRTLISSPGSHGAQAQNAQTWRASALTGTEPLCAHIGRSCTRSPGWRTDHSRNSVWYRALPGQHRRHKDKSFTRTTRIGGRRLEPSRLSIGRGVG